ncbi:hypothetical protein [Sphaerotilus sp.]|uniref:hypothetical protein n=1 Tax=Sphaerotilus sp. TaxID=2093942 RepID=UPI00286E1A32|nr:hypothetical protein [Sphaerotilus sp.]
MFSFLTSASRRLVVSTLLVATGLCAGAAQAGGVQWSIGIQLPAPPVVFYPASPQRVYAPEPVYVQQAPRVVYVEQQQRPWPRHHRHHWQDDDRWDDGSRGQWRDNRGDWRHGR